MADEFGKFVDRAQGGDRNESRFSSLRAELNAPDGKSRTKYVYQCRVFTVFRPWQECYRCLKAFRPKKGEDGETAAAVVMDEDADYVCPHNENTAYTALANRMQKNEVVLVHRVMETLKSGVVQVVAEWGEPTDPGAKERPESFPRL